MGEYNISSVAVSDHINQIKDYEIASTETDSAQEQKETEWRNDRWSTQ